jgi:hypothetical protein
MVPASLDACGFTLVENSPPPVQDWSDKEEICKNISHNCETCSNTNFFQTRAFTT